MIQSEDGTVLVTNDGATILSKMNVFHPAAKMLVGISNAQDVEAGDGTTSVVVLCGSLLKEAQKLLGKGIHPSVISKAWGKAVIHAGAILEKVAAPVKLRDREMLVKAAKTSLSSKVISQYADTFAPIAVDSVLRVIDADEATNVDLDDIRIVTKIGGTMDDTELVDGIVFGKGMHKPASGGAVIENARIALIQFCLSAPKTDIDNQVVVSEYSQMDRILREERKYILKLCKAIKKSGCNVLLVQKSILRDAVNDLSLHLSTIFTEVRLKKYLEVRSIDECEWDCHCAGPAFYTGLIYGNLDEALSITNKWNISEVLNAYIDAPKKGLKTIINNKTLLEWGKIFLKIAKKGLKKRSIKNNQGQDETIFLRSVESVLNNNKSKAASTIEKFKVQKNLKFLYEKI